ncbi:molecular chaperone (small heat shock protein) [Candidatus Nitrososphaera evergladensis SR1]|jgi:HSP20 family protein|uniref:Molecular chaperone (Small heat shock protein) n=1 Tax=Candidatus Nitrososphaera evergladensis SR1 TaxID=1459636 RepID=A0A075MPQ1_9ARCH|nr:archaeal heat shock protein Hsp14 [Candidatus Nitrososphaera evergladensis]AIF83105.1 molecular chaperone (small heat shock protein) [Candidatus Nitrososphaera evergladensis SR1]
MGIGRYVVREVAKELDHRSREFYEFVMPAIDMVEEGSDLVVMIDLPGFAKQDIALRIQRNILSITAKRAAPEETGTVYQRHRPLRIEKSIVLPITVKEGEKVVGTATYTDGVVTLRIPVPSKETIPIT